MSVHRDLPDGWQPPVAPSSVQGRLLRRLRGRTLRSFHGALDDPALAQQQALERVLDASENTAFAEAHGLAGARTIHDFRAAVPVRPSAEHEPWLRRARQEGPGVLTRLAHTAYNRTSGTTGTPKDLPVTEPWARVVSEAQVAWVDAMLAEHPAIAAIGARALTSVGRRVEATAPSGLPIGSNTGRMHGAQPWWVKLRYAVPARVFALPDLEIRTYTLLRLALAVDVRSWTTANPSTILQVCRFAVEHGEDLARDLHEGTLRHGPARDLPRSERRALLGWTWRRRDLPDDPRPGAFWPNLQCINCWKGGSAPFFLDRLPDALGARVPVREVGVSASEGHLAVPLHSSWWGGVMHVGGHLVELLPEHGGPCVLAHEAEVGRVYRPIVSTTAGLYRYDLGDRVRVEGHWRATPVVRFVGKVRDVVSLTGEKVTVEQLVEASRALSPGVRGWAVRPVLGEIPRLELLVEGGEPGDAAAFEAALVRLNGEYRSKRESARYDPVRGVSLAEGTWRRWRARRAEEGAADGQIKEPVLVGDAEAERLIGA